MKKYLIIEDEPINASELERLLKDFDEDIHIESSVDSVASAIDILNDHTPDLIFMDIELADGSAFEIFEAVDVRCPVIFTTAYDEHALQAFDKNGLAYLLKPITREKLKRAFDKLESFQQTFVKGPVLKGLFREKGAFKENFLFKKGNSLVPVRAENILYFFGEDTINYVVDTSLNQYLSSFNLSQLEEMLDPKQFFRVNRQYIVHRQAVKALKQHVKGQVKLIVDDKKAAEVIVSRQKTPLLKEWLN